MHILANNDSRNIKKYLKKIGLETKFKSIIGRNDVKYTKPNEEGINQTIKDKNKRTFLMIGDSIDSDKAVAKRGGVGFYLIDYFKKINYLK